MSDEFMLYKIQELKKLIHYAFRTSEHGHEILFKDSYNTQNALIAATYINKAISLMASAKAVYISNIEQLENHEIEEIFGAFDTFESEFLSNLSTNHSHQWTDIEFERFKELVESSIQF